MIVTIAFISFLISHWAGTEGRRRAKRFDWEAYAEDINRQKRMHQPSNKFTTAKIIAEAKMAKNYVVGVDTNILIEDYRTLDKLAEEKIPLVISNKVRQELDGLKKHQDERVQENARLALKSIYELELQNKLTLIEVTKQQTEKLGLNLNEPDEYIVASYLSHSKPVIFFTNDNNARLTAKQRNLHVQELHSMSNDKEDPFQIKPGNQLKWVSLLTYCIGVGLTFVMVSIVGSDNATTVDTSNAETIEQTFKKSNLNVDSEGRFIIKNEFNMAYFGDSHEEWGGVALYDLKVEKNSGSMRFEEYHNYDFNFAYFIKDKKFEDFKDVIKIKISDGTTQLDGSVQMHNITNDSKLSYKSLGATVKMYGVNSAGYYSYTGVNEGLYLDLKKTYITFYHAITGEEVFKIKAVVDSKQLEGDE